MAPITRDERWRSDLHYFANQLAIRHKNAFAHVTKEAFARAVADLDTEIPDLSDSQVQLRIARLAAMLRDAHTHAQLLDAEGPARVVVDLRDNPGGDSRVIGPLIRLLKRRQDVNQPHGLYVIIGRTTASSGLMAAVDFRKETRATIVGEPTGERPNHYGELKSFRLPHSNVEVTYSTKFFCQAKGDPEAFYPDVSLPPTAESTLKGRDPMMEWILGQPRGTNHRNDPQPNSGLNQ